MLIVIVLLVVIFGGGSGYYGHRRWGYGGGAGVGLGTILLILRCHKSNGTAMLLTCQFGGLPNAIA